MTWTPHDEPPGSVWLVGSTYEYENYSILAVFSTEEKAVAYAGKLASNFGYVKDKTFSHWKGDSGKSLSVEEREVDKP